MNIDVKNITGLTVNQLENSMLYSDRDNDYLLVLDGKFFRVYSGADELTTISKTDAKCYEPYRVIEDATIEIQF